MIDVNDKASVVIVDGNNIFSRFYHAIPILTNPQGQPVHAIHGMTSFLSNPSSRLKVVSRNSYFVMAFDSKLNPGNLHPSIRELYKSNREEKPPDYHDQLKECATLARLSGWQVMIKGETEADDLIAGAVQNAKNAGLDAWIVTSDKDLYQLVGDGVKALRPDNTGSGYTVFGPDEVQKKWGIPPALIPQYLAMVGDTSDNLPGVPKIGEKTAVKILTEFGNIYNALTGADPKNKHRKMLEPHLEVLLAQLKIVTLNRGRMVEVAEFPECKLDLRTTSDRIMITELREFLSRNGLRKGLTAYEEMLF